MQGTTHSKMNDSSSIDNNPKVGDDVLTLFGRGKIIEVRRIIDDGNNDNNNNNNNEDSHSIGNAGPSVVVRISSWRLTGRSRVTCYLSIPSIQIVPPKKLFEMSSYEKVEHAESLKQLANAKFKSKKYSNALELYAKAVDAVRYVQHTKDSSNELRADLLVVMITCCNNAATCSIHLKDWQRAQKFGQNALVLLEALYEKKDHSNILKLLNREGVSTSKIFGTWMIKSHLVISRGMNGQGNATSAIEQLKKAQECFDRYKNEEKDENIMKQLHGQEKEIRKRLALCRDQIKTNRKIEKERARAMFSPKKEDIQNNDTKHSTPKTSSDSAAEIGLPTKNRADDESKVEHLPRIETLNGTPSTDIPKRVSFSDGTIPGEEPDEPSFLEEHQEALLLLGGVTAITVLAYSIFGRKR